MISTHGLFSSTHDNIGTVARGTGSNMSGLQGL